MAERNLVDVLFELGQRVAYRGDEPGRLTPNQIYAQCVSEMLDYLRRVPDQRSRIAVLRDPKLESHYSIETKFRTDAERSGVAVNASPAFFSGGLYVSFNSVPFKDHIEAFTDTVGPVATDKDFRAVTLVNLDDHTRQEYVMIDSLDAKKGRAFWLVSSGNCIPRTIWTTEQGVRDARYRLD